MTKRYLKLALVYAIMAMVFGVFYREFTKYLGYSGRSNLSLLHAHYFALGMFFFLVLALMERGFGFSTQPRTGGILVLYQAGLHISGLGFLLRGLAQATNYPLTTAMDMSLSGIAGVGHLLLGVCIVLLLLRFQRATAES